jgi:hypothetical protein
MSYQASGTIRCWKKYDCLGCGAVYRHRFSRQVSGTGATAEQAEASAQASGINTLRNQVDQCPCPECGRVQPRMVGHSKLGIHTILLAVAGLVMAAMLIIGATDVTSREVTAIVMLGIAGLTLLGHMWCAWYDPNANPEANKRRVAMKVSSGDVEVLRSGDPSVGEPPPQLITRGHFVYFVLGVLAVLLALVPIGVRIANGWTLSDSDPPVLGPGDRFRISFPDKIDCVRSTWAGSPTVTFDDRIVGATATSNNDSWGMSMAVKSSETHTSPTLWAEIQLPNDPALANRVLSGKVDMIVRFPQASGVRGMANQEKRVSRAFTVTLASPGAWQTYRTAWWGGLGGCLVLTLFAGWGFIRLASNMKWDAPPDLVEALDTPPSDQPPETHAPPADERRRESPMKDW